MALNCLACHGERGVNTSGWIPNLAGVRAEAIVKQLLDYKTGHRQWAVMNGIGEALTRSDINDVAAYFSALPTARPDPPPQSVQAKGGSPERDPAVRLIVDGDAGQGIAPCGSCHGPSGLKRAAPVLAGQQPAYIIRQLRAFQQATRRNDEGEQMRIVARHLTSHEIEVLANVLPAVCTPTGQPACASSAGWRPASPFQ